MDTITSHKFFICASFQEILRIIFAENDNKISYKRAKTS